MKLRSLKNNICAVINLSMVLMIGLAFAGMMVGAFIIWTLVDSLGATGDAALSISNVTAGFDSTINLLLVAITIFILALAISALLLLRRG